MYRVREQIEGKEADRLGYSGAGVTVAVLDTGIANHPDFDYRVIGFRDFVNGYSSYPYDDSSHGTHVCGILAGSGRASGGKIKGIASGCNLVVGKVLDQRGEGDMSDMLDGIAWVIENRHVYNIRILNISIGISDVEKEGLERDAMLAVEAAWNAGIMVVTAAGNTGPKPMSISSLGAGSNIITVGCHEGGYFGNRQSLCENYSGRGPSKYAIKKPDIVAPGTDIYACNSGYKQGISGYRNAYTAKSGTSMATPIVAGACALLMEKYPYWSNTQIKDCLFHAASDLGENWSKQGWGMVNIKNILR